METLCCRMCGCETTCRVRCEVCGGDNSHPLDAYVNAATAFHTWSELVNAMLGGYVPTIYPTTRRKEILANAIKTQGFRVWPGK